MGFTKTTRTERQEILSTKQHAAVETSLRKAGKASATELTEEEREALARAARSHS